MVKQPATTACSGKARSRSAPIDASRRCGNERPTDYDAWERNTRVQLRCSRPWSRPRLERSFIVRNRELLESPQPPRPKSTTMQSRRNGIEIPSRFTSEAMPSDSQQVLRKAECATAVADDRERIATDLYDKVIHQLFAVGLQLQATCQLVDGVAQTRIEITIELLDTTIAELRKAIFSLH
jgi:signal transduction histidine kinase